MIDNQIIDNQSISDISSNMTIRMKLIAVTNDNGMISSWIGCFLNTFHWRCCCYRNNWGQSQRNNEFMIDIRFIDMKLNLISTHLLVHLLFISLSNNFFFTSIPVYKVSDWDHPLYILPAKKSLSFNIAAAVPSV